MKDERRWLVRRKSCPKVPVSPLSTKPIDYETPHGKVDDTPDAWRRRWTEPAIYSTYEGAISYWDGRPGDVIGPTFVLHHHGELEPTTRWVILDWDKVIVDGVLDEEVRIFIESIGSYTSYSQSKRGLHTVIRVTNCPAFANNIGKPVGDGHSVDVLCANPVAVTGIPFEEYTGEVVTIDYAELEAFPFFKYKKPTGAHVERPEWWDEDPIESVPDHLTKHIPQMEVAPAIEGQGGSQVLFAAACYLGRNGIIGREAEALLRCVPANPKFDDDQIQRTIECAFNRVTEDDEFGVPTPEFDILPGPSKAKPEEPPPPIEEVDPEDREKLFGYNFLTADELLAKEIKLEWLIERAFVGEGTLFIGGDQKTFKTGLAMDLLVSLSTGAPFLNHFQVNETKRSVMFTAEIGEVKAQLLLRSILQSRGSTRAPGLDIVNEVPQFSFNRTSGQIIGKAIERVDRYLRTRKPEVAVFDPLYLAILGGEAGDMYGMGAIIDCIVKACNKYGVWAIFCHHSKKKNQETEFQPMRLNDFYGVGPAQYARQWMLVSHSEPFRNGVANIFATIGGSTQSREDVYEIRIDEGVSDELADRRWDVTVDGKEESAELTPALILDELDGHPKGLTSANLAFALDKVPQKKQIETLLRVLVREGRVIMNGNKFAIGDL